MGLEEKVKSQEELYKVIEKISDPYNNKISQVKMRTISEGEGLILLTELPSRVNITTYLDLTGDDGEYTFLGNLIFSALSGIRRGYLPQFLYKSLWKLMENNDVWNLKDAEASYFDEQLGVEMPAVLGAADFDISIFKGDKRHQFRVYAPNYDEHLIKYRKIVNRIFWLSHFAFAKVRNVQPYLNRTKEKALRANE